MLQVEEALAAVLSAAASARAAPRGVPLHDALGLVLAEEVRAPDPLPPFCSLHASAAEVDGPPSGVEADDATTEAAPRRARPRPRQRPGQAAPPKAELG
jgi:molybdopterin biosynthesis enzyme